jgi:superfamily I DNA and/or RNA helicase
MKETVAVDDAIVDEAAAATVPELCIGLWLVNDRLLLVGDPHQLPASVSAEYNKQNGLDKSLQDRLMNQCDFKYTMLDVQYRMKKEISEFPFKTFYKGKVSDGENVLAFSYKPDAALLDSSPYAFIQVQAEEQRDRFGSCYNTAECDVVMGLLQDLRHRSRHVGNDWTSVNRVRVITFYQAQVSEMKRRLHRHGLQNIVVSTVDSSQGCEADIIIISFVRSEKVGFLSDYRRLNVALTRAKHQLVCVGNAKTLASLTSEKAQFVSKLAKDAIGRRCLVTNYGPTRRPLEPNSGQKKPNNRPSNRGGRKGPPPKNNTGKRPPPRDNHGERRAPDANWKKLKKGGSNGRKKTPVPT